MAEVVFITSGGGGDIEEQVYAEDGAKIIDVARLAGINIETPCNGTGVCGKCGVEIEGTGRSVLACQGVVEDGARYAVRNYEKENKSLRILCGGSCFDYERRPSIFKKTATGKTEVYGGSALLGVEDGDTSASMYGLAVDIGTTTIVVSLADLQTGSILASESEINPQVRYAQDVLGRIHFAGKNGGLRVLYNAFTETLNAMTAALAKKLNVNPINIYEAVYSGNTTMLHLACNVDPSSIGRFPYDYPLAGGCYVEDPRLCLSPFARIYLPPVISAYVGADIASGILITRLARKKGVTLFIDIGTNGEMVIAKDGHLAASSTAAGPAFEGMNISCGMRASSGAIESFLIEDSDALSYKTIGGAAGEDGRSPAGVCGSGLLDIAAEFARRGIIDKSGRFAPSAAGSYPPALREHLRQIDGKPAFFITGGVYISQKDIRQIQLAKGAIRCGIEMLLSRSGAAADEVDEVIIAGSFGYHLNENSLINTGILPPQFAGRVSFAGNTSLSGAAALLLNVRLRDEIKELAGRVRKVELAEDADFERTFIEHMSF